MNLPIKKEEIIDSTSMSPEEVEMLLQKFEEILTRILSAGHSIQVGDKVFRFDSNNS